MRSDQFSDNVHKHLEQFDVSLTSITLHDDILLLTISIHMIYYAEENCCYYSFVVKFTGKAEKMSDSNRIHFSDRFNYNQYDTTVIFLSLLIGCTLKDKPKFNCLKIFERTRSSFGTTIHLPVIIIFQHFNLFLIEHHFGYRLFTHKIFCSISFFFTDR